VWWWACCVLVTLFVVLNIAIGEVTEGIYCSFFFFFFVFTSPTELISSRQSNSLELVINFLDFKRNYFRCVSQAIVLLRSLIMKVSFNIVVYIVMLAGVAGFSLPSKRVQLGAQYVPLQPLHAFPHSKFVVPRLHSEIHSSLSMSGGNVEGRFPTVESTAAKSTNNYVKEILAGLVVALVTIPTSISYSTVVGVNPITGIWNSAIVGLLTALVGGAPGEFLNLCHIPFLSFVLKSLYDFLCSFPR
jgi:hypothetical protein